MAKKVRKSGGRLTPAEIATMFDRFAAANPDPRGELSFINPYTLLVAVVLSAQATDASVNKATEPLFKRVDTPAAMLKLGEARLKDYIRTIGLYNTKARSIIRLSQILEEQYGGQVPVDREILQTLPGVGRKTANVLLGHVFGQPGLVVDTHVRRLARRLGLTRSVDPDQIELDLQELLPAPEWTPFSMRLILHGRRVCHARSPRCEACVVRPDCPRIGLS